MSKDTNSFWFQYNPARLDEECSNLDDVQDGAYRRLFDRILRLDDKLIYNPRSLAVITKTGRRWKAVEAVLIEQGLIRIVDGFVRCDHAAEIVLKTRKSRAQKVIAAVASHGFDKRLKNKETAPAAAAEPQADRSPTAAPPQQQAKSYNSDPLTEDQAPKGAARGEGVQLPPIQQTATVTTKPAAPGVGAGEILHFQDEAARVRAQLWQEGKAILGRLAPAMPSKRIGEVVGMLAKANGSGIRGGTRAIQALRDVEGAVAASQVPGYAAAPNPTAQAEMLWKYLLGVVQSAKRANAPPGAAQAPEPKSGSTEWVAQQRAARLAKLQAQQGIAPSGGPIIDGKAEAVG